MVAHEGRAGAVGHSTAMPSPSSRPDDPSGMPPTVVPGSEKERVLVRFLADQPNAEARRDNLLRDCSLDVPHKRKKKKRSC